MKNCTKCKVEKDESEFSISASKSRDGLLSWCRSCKSIHDKEYNKKYLERTRKEIRYGLSQSEYDQMVKDCNSCCAICGKRGKLCIDHDHSTENTRGLLCNNCNTAIGLMQDNPIILRKAADYLIQRKKPVSLERMLTALLRNKHNYD